MPKKTISTSLLILSDLAVLFLSLWIAHFIRSDILIYLSPKFKILPVLSIRVFLNHFYMASVWLLIFAYEKLYTKRYPLWEEIRVLLKGTTLSSALIMIMIFITKKQMPFSRTILVLTWLLSLFLFPFFRYLTKLFLVKFHLWKKKLIIIGANEAGYFVAQNVQKNKTMGYEIIGFLDDDPQKIGQRIHGIEVMGPVAELKDIAQNIDSRDIIISMPDLQKEELSGLIRSCESISESLWLVPQTGDLITTEVELETLGQALTLNIKKNLAKPWNTFIKGVFEKLLTILAVIVSSPLLLLTAVAIKLDSRGPVLFFQKRLGHGKKIFNMYKFRSMYVDSEELLSDYLIKNVAAKKEWEKYKKLKTYDPRLTKVGTILRKFSLDELPQLFNVLFGKMSLVGPRPYLMEELEGREYFIDLISKVKPGITGLWQVSGRSELPFEKRLVLDEFYIRNWSLWLDIGILFKSFRVPFSSKGAY